MLSPTDVHLSHPEGAKTALRVELLGSLDPTAHHPAVFFLMPGQAKTFTLNAGMSLRISAIHPDYAR